MAFLKTSDSIIIRATLTEKGKKLLARGRFKVAKFALGDDEIDYSLYNPRNNGLSGYNPALLLSKHIEASKDNLKNLQFGLDSYDSGTLYLTLDQLNDLGNRPAHAFLEYLPVLALNNQHEYLSYPPTTREDRYYLSINDETNKIITDALPDFKFLKANDYESTKIIVESGIMERTAEMQAFKEDREEYLVKKFLLDQDFLIYADNRFVSGIVGILDTSKFENYKSGEKIILFNTSDPLPAISIESEFEYYATYMAKSIPNHVFKYPWTVARIGAESALKGPRGTIIAINPVIDNILKTNSTGERDSRFIEFGTQESILFSEMPTRKFDYIDTTIYMVGATTNARLQIPIRIIRYAGT